MPILHLILSSPKVNIPVSVKFLSDTTAADVNVQTEFRSAIPRGGSEPKKESGEREGIKFTIVEEVGETFSPLQSFYPYENPCKWSMYELHGLM